MPKTAAPKKKKTDDRDEPLSNPDDSVSESVRNLHREMRDEALTRWKEFAYQIADGGKSPQPRDLLEVAAVLRITKPGEVLEHDVEAIRKIRELEAAVERAQERRDEWMAPYGGDVQALKKAVEDAIANAERLKNLLNRQSMNGTRARCRFDVSRIKEANRHRLFPELLSDEEREVL